MKQLLSSLIILLGIFTTLSAQTHEIALKSHSGSTASIDRSGPERFGAIESPPLMKIERIQTKKDTATILYFGYFLDDATDQYRVENHPIFNNPGLNIDSLHEVYDGSIELVGFEEKADDSEKKVKEKKKRQWILPFAFPKGKLPKTGLLIILGLICSIAWNKKFVAAFA